MPLPFSRFEFFQLFAAYNAAFWPAVAALWLASVLAVLGLLSSRRPPDRWISALLTIHWAWSAIAYHLVLFTTINPAAWLFGTMFLVQSALFAWSGLMKRDLSFRPSRTARAQIGWLLIVYALLYPLINALVHGSFNAIPTFGLPCPTTIFTAGLLLHASSRSRPLVIIPIVWSVIGGSAAFLFGVSADYALPVAGLMLALFAARKPLCPQPMAAETAMESG